MTPEFVRKYHIYKILSAPKSIDGYVKLAVIEEELEIISNLHKENPLYKALLNNSTRNIKRDIKSIEVFFGLEINQKRGKGYRIDKSDLDKELQQLIFDKIELFILKHTEKKWSNYITPEQSSLNTNLDIIGLTRAIEHNLYVHINYKGWYDDANFKTTQTKIQPLHLKQINKGWYLLGYDAQNGVYAYCLDARMESLTISEEEIATPNRKIFDVKHYFKNLIGILNEPNTATERIVLQVANHHFKYLETKPLPSQEIIAYPKVLNSNSLHKEDYLNPDIWGIIAVTIQPNYEFIMELFRYNIWVKVIEPQWFANQIADQYHFLAEAYYPKYTRKK